jgi:peptidoglycan/xylan/chitin deacetylase (PgdA/CDA1 family)
MPMRLCFMLHSILDDVKWPYDSLVTYKTELKTLVSFYKRLGFTFVKSCDLASCGNRCVSLTFDDGYLDNWTLLHPLLEAEHIPYTVFINKDFVEESTVARAFGVTSPGYLNIAEIKRMHESGIADIQSHSVTHTWYPTSPRIIDVFTPNQKAQYPWMLWNRYPAAKPSWLHNDYRAVNGLPVFEHDRSLRAHQFLFDIEMLRHFEKKVADHQLNPDAANLLLISEYKNIGRLETKIEQEQRYEAEIRDNDNFINDILGYHPSILCWPGGAYNPLSIKVAHRFHATTTIKRGFGLESHHLHRLSPGNPYARDRFPWNNLTLTLGFYTARYCAQALHYRSSRSPGHNRPAST